MKLNKAAAAIGSMTIAALLSLQAQAFSIQLGGRVHIDYSETDSDTGDGDSEDFEFRRVRLAAKGDLVEHWKYKVQVEFDSDAEGGADIDENDSEEVDFKDVYFRYTGFGNMANITLGQQYENFSLQGQTSSNDITLLSRSSTIATLGAHDRNVGLQVHGSDNTIHYGVGVFRDDREKTADGDTKVLWAFTGRAAYSPINDEGDVLHFAIGYTDRDGGETGTEANGVNLEAAWVAGPLSIQSETTFGEVNNEDQRAGYVQAAYTLTGESRPYKGGIFKRIKPAEEVAFEVALRLFAASADLATGGDDDTRGYAFGANAYLNNYVKFGLQFIDQEIKRAAGPTDEIKEIRLRGQIAF